MRAPRLQSAVALSTLLMALTGCSGLASSAGPRSLTPAGGFSIAAQPSTTLSKGAKTKLKASVSTDPSFSGSIALTVLGVPSGVTATFSPATVEGSATPTLSLSASNSAAAGAYTLTLSATSNNITQTSDLALVVPSETTQPDFSVAATPNLQPVTAGGSVNFTALVAPLNGFSGTVDLTASGMTAGMSASFNPASINTTGSSTLTISTSSTVQAGNYTLTIAGLSGGVVHSTTVGVTVSAAVIPDFSFTASPAAQSMTSGSTATFAVNVSPLKGFNSVVTLGASGMPAGVMASFSPSSIVASGASTLTITAASSAAPGTYGLTLSAGSGALRHSAVVDITITTTSVPDFTVSMSPGTQTLTAGGNAKFITTVGAQDGFSGTVGLSVTGLPTGVTSTFQPASVATSGSSTLALVASKAAVAGSYTLTVTGGSGNLAHSTNVTLVISSALTKVSLNVLSFPGATGDPYFRSDVPTYLYNNPTISGATIAIEWSGSDGGSGQYDWTYPDAQIQPWIQAGKKVNLVVWAIADNSSNTCGAEGQYGQSGTGNCALPSYVWKALGSANVTTCTSQYGTQQMPNYLADAFRNNYQTFMAAVIQHYAQNTNIGYIRFGLGHGGESLPVAGWNDTSTACGQAYVNSWGLSTQSWEQYLSAMLNYEGSLNSPVQLMLGVTPMGSPGTTVPDYAATVAVQNNIGFGSQGLEASDVNNCSHSTADWCSLFNQYTGQVPLELQTVGQSCPAGGCSTGSLVDLIPFAVLNHATVFEIYYQDWLTGYDPNYPGYFPAYQPILQAAAGN